MKEFIKRNSPVFVIGTFTAIIFIVLTIVSQFKKQSNTNLIPLTDNQIKIMEEPAPKTLPVAEEIDSKYGPLEIEYTTEGFNPKNTKSYQNQLIKWTNKTDTAITMQAVTKTHKDFPNEVEIKPGETFEFRLTKPKLWSYQQKDNTKMFGTIFVLEN